MIVTGGRHETVAHFPRPLILQSQSLQLLEDGAGSSPASRTCRQRQIVSQRGVLAKILFPWREGRKYWAQDPALQRSRHPLLFFTKSNIDTCSMRRRGKNIRDPFHQSLDVQHLPKMKVDREMEHLLAMCCYLDPGGYGTKYIHIRFLKVGRLKNHIPLKLQS